MNIPDELRHDHARRGPAGTEFMGVSVALPLKEVQHEDGTPWSEEDWRNFIQHAQPQLLEMLRVHVGGARPQGEPQFSVEGPHPDPLQGPLYVMSAGAWVYPAALPVDCSAYRARQAPTP